MNKDEYVYKVSVIIPVYNTEQYLEKCVKSVLYQTLNDIEILLIDDGSSDDSGYLCDKLAKNNSNIKVVHKKNEGLGLTRNCGIRIARGEYITFLDSDDKIRDDYLLELYNKAKYYSLDICYSNGFIMFENDEQNEFTYHSYYFVKDLIYASKEQIRDCIVRTIDNDCHTKDGLPGSACISLYRRSFILENKLNFLSERVFISEDIWFNLDCLSAALRVGYIPYRGYCYRYNPNSLSRGYRKNRFEKLYSSVIDLDKKCCDMGLIGYEGRVNMFFWNNFEKCINQEVRYSVRNGIAHISEMCELDRTKSMLKYLYENKLESFFHRLLCAILFKKKYKLCFILLKIYNLMVH